MTSSARKTLALFSTLVLSYLSGKQPFVRLAALVDLGSKPPFAAVDTKVGFGPFMSIDTKGGEQTYAAVWIEVRCADKPA